MSKATKRKHVAKEVLDDYVVPDPNQQIVKVSDSLMIVQCFSNTVTAKNCGSNKFSLYEMVCFATFIILCRVVWLWAVPFFPPPTSPIDEIY